MHATRKSMRLSKQQRRNMSLPEVLLWRLLRRSPSGVKFRRQHAIGPYVADFYCASAKMVIEIDGFSHDTGDRPLRDEVRDRWLEGKGFIVTRIPARSVLDDPVGVAEGLIALCSPDG